MVDARKSLELGPWFSAPDAIRSALGAGRASAVAQAIADEPPAHTLAAEVAAAKAPFDAALSALDTLTGIAEAADNLIDDVNEALNEDLRLHDLQQTIGAMFLGYGGSHNHEDDLRAALGRVRDA